MRLIFAFSFSLMLTACGQQGDSKTAAAPPQMPPLPVSFVAMQATAVPIATEVVAQTEGAKSVEVRPRVGGIVLKKMFTEGETVKAGQTMFLIDAEPFKIAVANAQAQVARQKARVQQTQREMQRLKQLLSNRAISQREYDNATADNAIAQADLQQANAQLREAKLQLGYTQVKAPNAGIAGRFAFSEGALVAANTSLLTTITQVSPIWVRFSLSESELAQLGGYLDNERVEKVNLLLPNGTEYPETGRLNYTASTIDPALGTQQLRAEFANKQRDLLPGQFVRVKVTTGTQEGVFLVPQAAVLTSDQGSFVYVAETKEGKTSAAVRPVKTGGWQGKDWVVLDGLKAGDRVLVDNLIKIRPNAPINPHPFGQPPAQPPAPNS